MIEQIYNYFTIEILYYWVNLGVLPFWLILIFFPNSKICRIFVTSIFPFFILSGVYIFILYKSYLSSYYYTFRYRLTNDGLLNAVVSHFIIYLASKLIFILSTYGENALVHNVFALHCMYVCIDIIYFRRFYNCSVHTFVMFIYYTITKNRTIKDILF